MALKTDRAPEGGAKIDPAAWGWSAEQALVQVIADPTPAFLLRWRPDNWQVQVAGLERLELLPDVSAHLLAPGICGVHQVGGEYPNIRAAARDAIEKAERQGWKYLPPEAPIDAAFLPPGVAAGGYARVTECLSVRSRTPGRLHHEVFQVFEAGLGEQPHMVTWRLDLRNRWLLALKVAGVFGAPSARVMQRLCAQAGEVVERVEAAGNVAPDLRARLLKRYTARKEAVEAACG